MRVEPILHLFPFVFAVLLALWIGLEAWHRWRTAQFHRSLLKHDALYLRLWKGELQEEADGDEFGYTAGQRQAYLADRMQECGLLTTQEHTRALMRVRRVYGAA